MNNNEQQLSYDEVAQEVASIQAMEPDLAVTFNNYQLLTFNQAYANIQEFENRMALELFGKQLYKLTDEERPIWTHCFNIEVKNSTTNSHFHSVVKFGTKKQARTQQAFKNKAKHVWAMMASQRHETGKVKLWVDDYNEMVSWYAVQQSMKVVVSA